MSTNGVDGDKPEAERPADAPAPAPEKAEKKKPVGRIALKRKPSRPPWAIDPVREIGPEGLTPIDPPKDEPKTE